MKVSQWPGARSKFSQIVPRYNLVKPCRLVQMYVCACTVNLCMLYMCMCVFVWGVSVFMCYSPHGWLRDYLLIIHVTASEFTAQTWKRFSSASFTHTTVNALHLPITNTKLLSHTHTQTPLMHTCAHTFTDEQYIVSVPMSASHHWL